MAFTTVPDKTTGDTFTEAMWDTYIRDNLNYLKNIAYVEFTADVTVSATTAATANTVVSSGAVTYQAAPIVVEFGCSRVETGVTAASAVVISLWDDTTDLGRIGMVGLADGTNAVVAPVFLTRQLTPTAASHTYIIKAHRSVSNGAARAGVGGADVNLPGYIRVRGIPT